MQTRVNKKQKDMVQENLRRLDQKIRELERKLEQGGLSEEEEKNIITQLSLTVKNRSDEMEGVEFTQGQEDPHTMDLGEDIAGGSSSQTKVPTSVQSQSKPEYGSSTNEDGLQVKKEFAEGSEKQGHEGGAMNPASQKSPNIPIGPLEREVSQDADQAKPGGDDDDEGDPLVSMKTLSISGHRDGIVDAWFRERQSIYLIVRYGSKRRAKYVIQPGRGYNTAGLQQVSDPESRIPHVMKRDESGIKRRYYGIDNIEGIMGVAIMEKGDNTSHSKAPTTYAKVKWIHIREEHKHLCTNRNNWNTRSDLIGMIGQEMADEKMKEAWEVQEERYNELEKEKGRAPPRSTPFPLDMYKEARKNRAWSAPLKHIPSPTVKREESPSAPTMDTSDEGKKPTASRRYLNPTPMAQSPGNGSSDNGITQDREHSNSNNASIQDKSQQHRTFSKDQYLDAMKEDLELNELKKENLGAFIEQMALVRAKYDVYRSYMEGTGAIEVA